MRAVVIKVVDKGNNPAARFLTPDKTYPAIRTEAGERDTLGRENLFTYYELRDDRGVPCGIYKNYLGVAIHEVP